MNSPYHHTELLDRMKAPSYVTALSLAVPVRNTTGDCIGKLVPVGPWVLADEKVVQSICDWRERAMRMYMVQFRSSFERTANYLRTLSIGEPNRIFFLIFDDSNRLIGHIGMSNLDDMAGELDNLMRGVQGGDARLIYHAELALLDWCFRNLGISKVSARVLSYNGMVIALHEEVGFVTAVRTSLFKNERDSVTYHDSVEPAKANVKYQCLEMMVPKDRFYERAAWLAR